MALKMPTKNSTANPLSRVMGGNHQSTGLLELLPRKLTHEGFVLDQHIREGRFQRSLALITAFSSLLSGLEVTYEHYVGSYSQRIMYTPVLISPLLFIVGIWSVFQSLGGKSTTPNCVTHHPHRRHYRFHLPHSRH